MKSKFHQIIFAILLLSILSEKSYSANELFRSIATGNWDASSTWEMSTNNGSNWIAATMTPTQTSGAISVRSPNTVTVTVNVSADQLTVETGGTLTINSSITFTLLDGSSTDFTVLTGGIVSGPGIFQTQGTAVSMNIRNGSSFNTDLEINSGTTTASDQNNPYTGRLYGTVTIDSAATLTTGNFGGSSLEAYNDVTNNGTIAGANGATFVLRGPNLVNNNSITSQNFRMDSTSTISGGGSFTSSTITISSSGNISLSGNVTFSPIASFTNGGTLNPNTHTFTFNSGTFAILSGGIVSNSGIVRTQGTVALNLRNGSNFNAPLIVNTGTTTANDASSPFIGKLFGTLTVDNGATLSAGFGGYFLEAHNDVSNNGTISGTAGATFVLSGKVANNSSTSTSTISGTGSYSSQLILIDSSGNVNLGSDVTFSPFTTFTINKGGILNPNSQIFTLSTGQLVLNTGATVSNSGTFKTQGTVALNLKEGSNFNAPLKVSSGTTTANNTTGPFIGRLYETVTVENGATLSPGIGGYFLEAYNNVTNNGTISGSNGATFAVRGQTLINNGSITASKLDFDSASAIFGAGTYTSSMVLIDSSGNVSLGNNVTFSPGSTFTVNQGGILNPNSNILSFTTGTFILNGGGMVSNSGTFMTQGTVALNLRSGSIFNAPLRVHTGTTTASDQNNPYTGRLYGTVTVENAATLTAGNFGGASLEAYNDVTNNGTIAGANGATFVLRGPNLVNNNSITSQNFRMDSASTISGGGSFTSSTITISSSGNISLSGNVTFSPIVSFTNGGTFNPNTHTFTFNSGAFAILSGGIVSNSGIVRTQGTVALNLRNGSSFNAPLIVNTGTTTANDASSPFIGKLFGTLTVDNGATLTAGFGAYFLEAHNDVTNNGTIAGTAGATFRLFGTNFINNGNTIVQNFNFQSGAHTLQGTGSWTTAANLLSGSIVTLHSNHQMLSVNINSGATFDISNFTAKFTTSNPITQNGTFTVTNSNVEYDGTTAQTISTTNITYEGLRINNSAGTILSNNVAVNDTLSVILGDLDLNGKIITISSTGYLTETPGNTVKGNSGHIMTTRNVGTPSALNVGGLGAVLTATTNLGITEIKRGHTIQNGLNGGTSIRRYFDINPTNNNGLNASLIFKYDDSELNGKPEPSLKLFKSTNIGTTWVFQGGNINTATNEIILIGITSYSRWSADSSHVSAAIGLIMEGFYNVATNNLNMSDTVRAYLRNSTNPFAIVDSSKGLLDSLTFRSALDFPSAPSGTYYIQLKHRNSLETWSKFGVNYIQDSTLNYDFTIGAAQAFGNNMIQKGMKFCLYSGDVTQDGFIDLTDVLLIDNDATSFLTGYVNTDANGNSIVDLTDVLIAYNNSINFVTVKRP